MPLVIIAVVLVVLIALTVVANRRTRRRLLGGSAEGSAGPGAAPDPKRAADQLRATIDAENGRGYL